MAKKTEDFSIDLETKEEIFEIPKKGENTLSTQNEERQETDFVNCLRNERVIVRHIPRQNGINISNPKHVAYGGMLETAVKSFCVPTLESGALVNVLTKEEKSYLEEVMGLEFNALSVYKKKDNFWFDRFVNLKKQDNYLDLSVPDQYIDYKILLANKDYIAKSLQELEENPKATYQFVIIAEGEEDKKASTNISITMQCYKEFGKIEDNIDILRTVIETIDGRPTAPTVKLEFLKSKANDLIQANSKLFLKVVTDNLLPFKVLIKKSVEAGLIAKRGSQYHLIENGSYTPLCDNNEEPTLNIAAKYLASPKRQELKFMLESKLK